MRHKSHHGRLGVQPAHRRAMVRNMVTSLLKHERIKTTKIRAKEVRRFAEKMITSRQKGNSCLKKGSVGFLREREVVNKLFKTLIYRYAQRKGGYTRILKLGFRAGDGAEMVFLELVDRPVEEKPTEPATVKKTKKGKESTEEGVKTTGDSKASKEVVTS